MEGRGRGQGPGDASCGEGECLFLLQTALSAQPFQAGRLRDRALVVEVFAI